MGYRTDSGCRRRYRQEATIRNLILNGPHIQRCWAELIKHMEEVVGNKIENSIKQCLLNIWGPTDLISSKERLWVALGLKTPNETLQNWRGPRSHRRYQNGERHGLVHGDGKDNMNTEYVLKSGSKFGRN